MQGDFTVSIATFDFFASPSSEIKRFAEADCVVLNRPGRDVRAGALFDRVTLHFFTLRRRYQQISSITPQ